MKYLFIILSFLFSSNALANSDSSNLSREVSVTFHRGSFDFITPLNGDESRKHIDTEILQSLAEQIHFEKVYEWNGYVKFVRPHIVPKQGPHLGEKIFFDNHVDDVLNICNLYGLHAQNRYEGMAFYYETRSNTLKVSIRQVRPDFMSNPSTIRVSSEKVKNRFPLVKGHAQNFYVDLYYWLTENNSDNFYNGPIKRHWRISEKEAAYWGLSSELIHVDKDQRIEALYSVTCSHRYSRGELPVNIKPVN